MNKKNKNKDVESNFLLNWADKKLDITKKKQKNKIINDAFK
tara:strand:+ start:435 stop:557 length:123 start_codon:yes stop_codon:yes gene_type:complete